MDPAAADFYEEDGKDLDFYDFEPLPTLQEDEVPPPWDPHHPPPRGSRRVPGEKAACPRRSGSRGTPQLFSQPPSRPRTFSLRGDRTLWMPHGTAAGGLSLPELVPCSVDPRLETLGG